MRTYGHRWHDRERALRAADVIALHQTALTRDEILRHRFVAISLADGSSDNTAYDTRPDAMRHQGANVGNYAYLQIPLQRWSAETLDTLLWYVECAYRNGHRPEPASQLIIPTRIEDIMAVTGD